MNENSKQRPFRVLTLDGGGIRGLYTATLLDILHSYFSADQAGDSNDIFGRKFDLIAGTSTGGILAVALAAGIPLKDIVAMYKEHGAEIFPPMNRLPANGLLKCLWAMRFCNRPAANIQALRQCLVKIFKEATIEDVYKMYNIALCIPAVNVETRQPVVIKTPHAKYIENDGKLKVVDVCLATSAAPTYLPALATPRMRKPLKDVFVDGGLWANNPILVGLVEALRLAGESQPIEIISVGAYDHADRNFSNSYSNVKGVFGWILQAEALNLSINAQAAGHIFIAKLLASALHAKCRIVRLPSKPPSCDDAKHIGIDKAYPVALRVLQQCAETDAEYIKSLSKDRNEEMLLVKKIFS